MTVLRSWTVKFVYSDFWDFEVFSEFTATGVEGFNRRESFLGFISDCITGLSIWIGLAEFVRFLA